MSSSARTAWGTLAVAAVMAALGALPGAAAASLSISKATLDGVTSTSAPPGSVLKASVTGNATGDDTWRGTEYRLGGTSACVDTGNQTGSNKTVSFNVTAPGSPGIYDAGFTARGEDSCGGASSGEKVLTSALNVTAPAANPGLPPRCGINVMLVLDKSGSIQSSGATQKVRDAASAFLTSLSGTGSKVSITDFSTSAQKQVGYTTVTADSIADTFDPYLTNDYNPSGWTNWEDAFQKVAAANAAGPVADLVVFITDGDPTAHDNPPGSPITGLTEGDVSAMRPAADEADVVKGQGSHVFAVGVGAAVTKPTSARRLTAISGFDQLPPTSFSDADYTLVENFDDLAAALRKVATELCQASVTVTKVVDEGDGKYKPDPGWKFTAKVSTDPGGYKWLQPAPPPDTGPRSEYTDDDGVAKFQWKPEDSTATSTVTLDEDLKPGYEFVSATCTNNAQSRKRRHTIRRRSEPVRSITIGPNQFYKCTVRNRIKPGTIEIEKQATPQSAQAFAFTGSAPLGQFSLVDDGKGASSSRIFTGLTPGTYTVSELVPASWALTGVTCTPDAAAVIEGPDATITLAPDASVVCTYQDTKLGTIEIQKSANPQSDQTFAFSGDLGDFTLVDDGKDGTTASQTFTDLAPGAYTVRELVPDNWSLTGVSCSDPGVAITGGEVSITLAAGGAVACAYRDTRNQPPAPPEPPAPPPPAPPAPPSPTVSPGTADLPSTQLRVVKRAPRFARVGQRIRFALTVTNVGPVAARNVRVADVPPGAVALGSLRTRTHAKLSRGNAVWRLGTLAPGAKRTIRGSVRIKAGTPGMKRNWVLATAVNSELVSARADTRLLARPKPPFTG
jgi:uncharacterized repeat protein (TIGR01451 family)